MLLYRHVKVEGLQVISKSRCKLFDGCYCILLFHLFGSLFIYFLWRLRAPSALMTFANPSTLINPHQPSRCCCFLTFRWISSLKLQTLLSAFWTGLGSASRRISGSLDFWLGGFFFRLELWCRTPLHIVFLDSLPHLQKQQADDSWVVRVSGAQECQMEYSYHIWRISGPSRCIYVRFYWQYVCIL